METLWTVIWVIIGLLSSVPAQPSVSNTTLPVLRTASLPKGWESVCATSGDFVDWNITTLSENEVNSMIQVSCTLRANTSISLLDFRVWTVEMPSSQKIAVQVTCSEKAAFRAPWPMKAKNLVFLRIQDCTIEDYFTEFFDPMISDMKDEIRVLEIKHSVIPMDFLKLHELVENYTDIVRDSYCGPVTVEKAAFNAVLFKPKFPSWFAGPPDSFGTPPDSFGTPPDSFGAPPDSFGVPPDYPDHGDFVSDNIDANRTLSPSEIENFLNITIITKALDKLIKLFLGTDIRLSCTYENLLLFDESQSLSLSSMDVIKKNSRFKALLTYNLSSVGFKRVPSELINWRSYTHFPKLKYLDLSHNSISDFEFVDFDVDNSNYVFEPGVIDLRYNNITQLTKKTLNSLFKLKSATVLVQGNPLDCSCENVTHLLRLLKENSDLGRYEYLRHLTCASPRHFLERRTEVGELTESEVCPSTPQTDLIILCSSLGATMLLLIVTSVLLIYYRKELVIIAFTRLRIKLSCRKLPALPLKMYDVFISSCDDDREWVKENIIDALNNFKGKSFSMCLREDWEFGVPIADMVAKSVDSSVHTLAVISSQSLRDEWRHFEFSLALHQSLKEKRRHLVVVFKEDVSKTDLLSEMRKYVATTPCIHFNRRLYRDRLIYALCHDEKNDPAISARSSSASSTSNSTFVSL